MSFRLTNYAAASILLFLVSFENKVVHSCLQSNLLVFAEFLGGEVHLLAFTNQRFLCGRGRQWQLYSYHNHQLLLDGRHDQ